MELAETGSKSTSEELKMLNFSGGTSSQTPLVSACFARTLYTIIFQYAANVASFPGSISFFVWSKVMRVPQREEPGNEATADGLSTSYLLPMGLKHTVEQ